MSNPRRGARSPGLSLEVLRETLEELANELLMVDITLRAAPRD